MTAKKTIGLVDTGFFVHQGFRVVDRAPLDLDLVALKFGTGADPRFLGGWDARLQELERGVTVFSTPQCPYTYEGAEQVVALARSMDIPARSVRLDDLPEFRRRAPSAYGSFDIAHGGKVVSNLFHCMSAERLNKLLAASATPSCATQCRARAKRAPKRWRELPT